MSETKRNQHLVDVVAEELASMARTELGSKASEAMSSKAYEELARDLAEAIEFGTSTTIAHAQSRIRVFLAKRDVTEQRNVAIQFELIARIAAGLARLIL